ncbi:substrate-binding domain-containing protein [Streptococcus massiliensis]|uniref:Ribose ABC transporter ribose-binding protein n=1 Tax=Streptococcus massiliensis TaxID=313439 RepID=A0A380KY03_9STRE|nr:substrate-binding domain-containing protein [Streptococcus massiliensis]SUN76431.1 ribose ABC transporter ribose-binding protein [Streptococcus massiliensis]
MSYRKTVFWMLIGLVFFAIVVIFIRGAYLPIFPRQLRVGATYMTMNNDFYKNLNRELEKNLSQRGDELIVRDPELDEYKQSQQIDAFVRDKVNVIVINPVTSDSKMVIKSLKAAKKAGIKIIAVDTSFAEKGIADTTILSDNYRAGVLIAKDMMKRRTSANILLLEHATALSAVDRIRGFRETIEGVPGYHIVSRRDTLGQTEESMAQVKQVLSQGTTFDVVMSLNDRSALGALAAIKEASLPNKVLIYGVDGSPDIKALLATTGDIQATVAQSPQEMGEKSAEVIQMIRQGKGYKKEYLTPVTLLDKGNIANYEIGGWQ